MVSFSEKTIVLQLESLPESVQKGGLAPLLLLLEFVVEGGRRGEAILVERRSVMIM